MPKLTSRGKEYSLDELIHLARVNTYGVEFSPAIGQALQHLKVLQAENTRLREELNSYQVDKKVDPTKESE